MQIAATGNDGRVVLWERHAAHPGGELFLAADGRTVEAGLTPAVQRLITDGLAAVVDVAELPTPAVEAVAGADSAESRPNRRGKRSK